MKKLLFATLSATLLLATSCVSDEVVETSPVESRTPISLSVYSKGLTRFTEGTINTLKASGFYIEIYTATKTIYSGTVSYNTTEEAYEFDGDTPYWPLSSSTVVYFAASSVHPTNDLLSFTGTEEPADILVANVSTSQTADNSVSLEFGHLVSRATFSLDFSGTLGMTANITNIELYGNNVSYDWKSKLWNTSDTGITYFPSTGSDNLYVPGSYLAKVTYDLSTTLSDQVGKTGLVAEDIPVTLVAGKHHKITFSLTGTQNEISISNVEVAEWAEEDNSMM